MTRERLGDTRRRTRLEILRRRVLPERALGRLLIAELLERRRTVVSRRRLENLHRITAARDLPPGAFVECGVGLGGCTALMAYVRRGTRSVWGFDSFEGMPALTEEDRGDGQEWVGFSCSGTQGIESAYETLSLYGVRGVRLVQGWFEETLPGHREQIGTIAVLRLDNDWYRSTRFCLEQLYPSVADGGVVIVDDYHTFLGCRKAVNEFREAVGVRSRLVTTEADSEAFWVKA